MKTIITVFLISVGFLFAQGEPRKVQPRDHVIMIDIEDIGGALKISWLEHDLAQNYFVFRREIGGNSFGTSISNAIPNDVLEYVDNTLSPGVSYEYQVVGSCIGSFTLRTQAGTDTTLALTYNAYGYAAGGLEAAERQNGRALVLVDETIYEAITFEVDRYIEDLQNEGWNPKMITVDRTEQFDGAAVLKIHETIIVEYFNDNTFSNVVLLGRVAVPYSGNIAPDAHVPDHLGAWPADAFYGQFSTWNDFSVNNVEASREQNRNVPGDGKFDNNTLVGYDVNLGIGRIDFYDMPLLYDEAFENPEAELIRRYLDKNHEYRNGRMDYQKRALIDDNFKSYSEGFSASGWRNFATLAGKDNVSELDWFTTLSTDEYMFAYGCGGGNYQGAGGVGSSADFLEKGSKGIFTFLFGSYFGDWDSRNNFLRAAIASEPSILTVAWAGRPQWYIHHIGLDYPMGYSTMRSQNNQFDYLSIVAFLPGNTQGSIFESGVKQVHTALMGDPTLTMNMNSVPKPLNFTTSENPDRSVAFSFDVPDMTDFDAYHFNIYKKTEDSDNFVRVNEQPLGVNASGTVEFEEANDYVGLVTYAVRTAGLLKTNSGSFYKESHKEFSDISTSVSDFTMFDNEMTIGPNPAQESVTISFNTNEPTFCEMEIYNASGNLVYSFPSKFVNTGNHSFKWSLSDFDSNPVGNGVYLVKAKLGSKLKVDKVIVNR